MRRQTVERLKVAASPESYVRVTARRGPCVIRGCRFWRSASKAPEPDWWRASEDAGSLEVDERTVLRGKQRERTLLTKKWKGGVCVFFSLWAETFFLSFTSAPLDFPVPLLILNTWPQSNAGTRYVRLESVFQKQMRTFEGLTRSYLVRVWSNWQKTWTDLLRKPTGLATWIQVQVAFNQILLVCHVHIRVMSKICTHHTQQQTTKAHFGHRCLEEFRSQKLSWWCFII